LLTPEQQALLQQHVTIDGDGNVVGDHATSIMQVGGDYAIQIGEQCITVTVQDLRRVLHVMNSQVGVVGDHATVHGGINFDQRDQHVVMQINVAGNYYEARTPYSHSGRCDYYHHISLPPHYIPRPEILSQTREALLESIEGAAFTSVTLQAPAALHGMGGVGKTVVARAVCDDPDVQDVFFDGILWTTLGQEVPEATLRNKLREWIDTLGGIVSESAPTLERLKAILAQILKERACLLIVDDVWRRQDAEAFQVGGPRCRLLITTRDAEIAIGLGARLQPVDVMAQKQALALLEEWARGQLGITDDRIQREIVKRLGYLPLAVRLAGEQLRRHTPEEWLARFDDVRQLRSSRPESIHDNLSLTFALSLSDLGEQARRCYLALAIFPENEFIPLVALSRLWESLVGLNKHNARDLLYDLVARALAQLEETDRGLALTIHGLLKNFITVELGEEGIQSAHGMLLDAYRATQEGEGWHTAPDDGYLYAHLTYHLNALVNYDATALKELRGLFANDAWLKTRLSADDHRYDGYLADLVIVWRHAHTQALAQVEMGEPVQALAESIHYSLIHTTVNTLVMNYSSELVACAVETSLWSSERALSILRRIADANKQVGMAEALLATGSLTKQQGAIARRIGLTAIRVLQDDWQRSQALAVLAPHLEGPFLTECLTAARAIQHEEFRATALAALAPHFEGPLLTECLAAARDIQHEEFRATALAALAPHLEGPLLAECLIAARDIQHEESRATVLAALAPHLEGPLLTECLAAARAIQHEKLRATALVALAPQLEGPLLPECLTAARAIQHEESRATALAALAPHLEGPLLAECLAAARDIQHEPLRAQVVLLGDFPEGSPLQEKIQGQVLVERLAAARAIQDQESQATALAALTLHLERPLLVEALAAARAIRDERSRSEVLTNLAPHLKDSLLPEALAATRAFQDDWRRSEVLTALAPHLEGIFLSEALDAARAIQDERWRSKVLTALAPQIEEELRQQVLTEALAAARAIQDEERRAVALTALASQLEEEIRQQVLTEALAAAHAIRYEGRRATVLAALAPHLEGLLLVACLVAARAIRHDEPRATALAAVAPCFREEVRAQVLAESLAAARSIQSEELQTETLALLTARLGGEVQAQTLTEALIVDRALQSDWWRARALAALVPHLEGPLISEGFAVARAIQNEGPRAEILAALAPHLEGELLTEALAVARAMDQEWYRAAVLAALAPHLEKDLLKVTRAALAEYLWDYQYGERQDLLNLLARDDAAFLRAFDPSEEVYTRIARSIVEICTQWEWL
jgi:hypothetical protein